MGDVATDYSNLEDDYFTVRTKLEQLSEDHKALVAENAELRQASLDGIAIADAIEELSQEREKLSVDLADRAATIKRLLEENSSLNYKLK
jgi:regulator of replication initiation timing